MAEPEESSDDSGKIINACPSCEQLLDVTEQEPYSKIQCPACEEMIRVRTEFNHFKLEKQIGEGGMSRVFRAEDVALGRKDALKILNRQFSKDERRTEQFEREATITASISHPNVVKVYSVGHDQAYFYIAMELVAHGSLDDLIRTEGKIEEGKALKIAIDVARGLRAAHNAGLIHRDVKPGNILFSENGAAKIVDFGLALMYETDSDDDGEIWATPYYVPPEKLDREPEDFRSDIYSLGATLFHALAGVPPFDADTTSILELKRLKAKPVTLADVAPHVGEATCDVVDRAMAVKASERHGSYEELIEHLQYARKCLTRGRSTPVGKAIAKPSSPWKMIGGIAAGVAVAGVVIGIVVNSGGGGELGDNGGGSGAEIVDLGDAGASVAARFLDARNALVGGDVDGALSTFTALAGDVSVPQPTLNWSRFNAGVCHLLKGDEGGSVGMFEMIEGGEGGGDVALGALFTDLSRVLGSPLEVEPSFAGQYPGNTVRGIALMAFGLKNWAKGEAGSAGAYLKAFEAAAPPEGMGWIGDYQKLVAPYLHDLAILEGFEEPSRGTPYPEVQKRFDEMEEAFGRFKIGYGVTATAKERLEEVRPKLAEMKKAYEARRAEEMATLRQAELEALGRVLQEIDGMRSGWQFTEGAEVLKQAHFETPDAKEACADQVYVWETAGGFLTQLVEDFNAQGYEGEIYRGTAAPVRGSVLSADADGIRVRAEGRESTIAFSDMPLAGLVKMAERVMEGISDSDAFYDRWEKVVAFGTLGRLPAAKSMGTSLAAEHRGFRERWERLNGKKGS